MRIEPYKKVEALSLAIREDELTVLLGPPDRKISNRVGLVEYRYVARIFRFEAVGNLCEVTVEAETVELNGVIIPFSRLAGFIETQDAHAFVRHGFIVSPDFGLAFDPEFSPWVTVLTKAGLALWQKI
jgi:hypothetical protein